MPSFQSVIRTRLKTDPALSTLSDVFKDEPGAEPTYPYLIINELYENPTPNLSGEFIAEKMMQFTVHSRTAGEARALGEAAYRNLMPMRPPSMIAFDTGYQIPGGRVQGQTRGPYAVPDRPEGDSLWEYQFDFTFMLGKYE